MRFTAEGAKTAEIGRAGRCPITEQTLYTDADPQYRRNEWTLPSCLNRQR